VAEIQKISYTHQAMIDLIIADPAISQDRLATHFGYTPAWICQVVNSDAFQAMLATRRAEIVNPELSATVEERFRSMTSRALQVVQDKLSMPSNCVPDNLALKAIELGAKALAVGGNAPPEPPGRLERLAERLLTLQQQPAAPLERIIDAEVQVVSR